MEKSSHEISVSPAKGPYSHLGFQGLWSDFTEIDEMYQ